MRFPKSPSERPTVATARVLKHPLDPQGNELEKASQIRLRHEQAVEGFALLLSKGQVQALPSDTYVVGPEHLALLNDAGIGYEFIGE